MVMATGRRAELSLLPGRRTLDGVRWVACWLSDMGRLTGMGEEKRPFEKRAEARRGRGCGVGRVGGHSFWRR